MLILINADNAEGVASAGQLHEHLLPERLFLVAVKEVVHQPVAYHTDHAPSVVVLLLQKPSFAQFDIVDREIPFVDAHGGDVGV